MKLLIVILKKEELVEEVLKGLAEHGVKGGTVLEGTGMAQMLYDMEDLPIFSVLRRALTEEDSESSHVLLFALRSEQAAEAAGIIKQVAGNLSEPNTGILFTVPIDYIEGLGE